jgi:putative transposase
MANGKLAKAMADGSFRMLRTQIEYKANWYGRQIMLADRCAATSKTCSYCEYKMAEMPLSVREWDCPQCGEHHDRDMNAARNILAFAIGSGRSEGAYPHVRGGVNPQR